MAGTAGALMELARARVSARRSSPRPTLAISMDVFKGKQRSKAFGDWGVFDSEGAATGIS